MVIKTYKEFLNENSEFEEWFKGSKVVNSDGSPKIMYHGTDKNFRVFNIKKTTQGIFWFTSDKSAIERGEVGAQGKGKILKVYLDIKNPAGWEEYGKLGLGQLEDAGYDGAILKDDGEFNAFVFNKNQIKIIK